MYKSLLVACLAASAFARPQHAHKHHRFHGTGTAVHATGTGAPFGTGNSTGPFANGTGTGFHHHTAPTSTSTVASVVTMTVMPLPLSSSAGPIPLDNDNNKAVASGSSACAGSQSTVTVTSTEMVTLTVDESSASSSASAAPPPSSSSSSSSSVSSVQVAAAVASSAAPGAFYGSSAAISVSVAPSSTVAASYTAVESSSAASATASSSSGGSSGSTSGSKRGVAYNDISLANLFADKGPVTWAYNWAATPGGSIGQGLEYVPMFWCPNSISQSDWKSAADAAIQAGSKHLLGANEPDQSGQCQISASDAASSHITYMNPYSGQASIGSPAVTNGGAPMGLTYLSSFFDSCGGKCVVDFLNIHWYNSYFDGVVDDFKNHVTQAITLAQQQNVKSVWVTEFALNGASDDQQSSFLNEVMPWLDGQSMVERYAFFMCKDGILTSGNSISSVGSTYIG